METTKKCIFIVEDDAVVVELYRRKLEREGFTVHVSQDGLDAMRMIPQTKPDLVLLDLMMPKFNGVDVLKFLRAHKDLKTTKVLIFTNAYMTELAQEAAKAGADRSLLKSTSTPSQLLNTIRELLAEKPEAPTPESAQSPQASTAALTPVESTARKEFFEKAPQILAGLREALAQFVQTKEPKFQSLRLEDFHRRAHFLVSMASLAECYPIAHLAGGLEALLFELQERPKSISPSVLKTIENAIALLGELFNHARELIEKPIVAPTTLLVVDDDTICSRALVHGLSRAKLRSSSTADPFAALKLVKENHYDLLLLDYILPGMDGIELCQKIRAVAGYETVPIIFITSAIDFRERAKHILKQGEDVITKPIFPIELALKVLTVLIKKQLQEKLAGK